MPNALLQTSVSGGRQYVATTSWQGGLMSPTITVLTAAQIRQRRAQLIADSGLDYDTLRERGEQYMLSPEQAAILHELENLDFLASA